MKYILAFLFVFQTLAYSQNREQEALLKSIENTDSANKKIDLYLKLAKTYKNTHIDSSIYFAEKGYAISKKINDEKGLGESATILADFYVAKNQFDKAKIYYTVSRNYLKSTDKYHDYCQITMRLGNINYVQDNLITAFKLYREALTLANKYNYKDLKSHLNNNIGAVYYEIADYKEAEKYFKVAYKLFKQENQKDDEIYALANLSAIYQSYGENDEAIKFALSMIEPGAKSSQWENLIFAYETISTVYLIMKDYDRAEVYVKKALSIIDKNKTSSRGFRGPVSLVITRVYQNAANIYLEKDELDNSLKYAHKSLVLATRNSFKKYLCEDSKLISEIFDKKRQLDSAYYYSRLFLKNYDQLTRENDSKEIIKLKMQYQFDEALRNKEIEDIKKQAKGKRNELIYLGISIFTVLGIIIMILLFRNQKAKTAKLILNEEKLELEKIALNNDLDYKRKELASNMMYLLAKNEFIISIAQKLKALKPETDIENQKNIKQLIVELNQNSTLKIWEEFEIRFKEVHSDFYDKLNKLYPDLTPNEIKICAFLRLNMSTKDISAITHQSVKSITMARFRMRKKLNIETEENLVNFMIQL